MKKTNKELRTELADELERKLRVCEHVLRGSDLPEANAEDTLSAHRAARGSREVRGSAVVEVR